MAGLAAPAACAAAGGDSRAAPAPARGESAAPSDRATGTAQAGRRAPSQMVPHRPRALTLPSGAVLGVDRAPTGARRVLQVPDDVGHAGWWVGSSRLGDPFGTVVLAAHVDSVAQGLGPVAEMLSARPGDRLGLSGGRLHQSYRVTSVRQVPRVSLGAHTELFSTRGPPRLVLVTCAGPYDPAWGGYRDNLVVQATPDGPLRRLPR